MRNHDQLIRIHEAGHAVVAVTLGQHIEKVTVEHSADGAGLCSFRPQFLNVHPCPTPAVQRDQLARTGAMIALAGPIAEFLAAGKEHWATCGLPDLKAVEEDTRRLFGQDVPAQKRLLAWAIECAEARVRAEWRAIERLASELARVRTIWGQDAEEIIVESLSDEAYKKWRWYRHILPHP